MCLPKRASPPPAPGPSSGIWEPSDAYWAMNETDLPNWDGGFDKPILLRDGKELRTLHEAGAFLDDQFAGQHSAQLTGAACAEIRRPNWRGS